MKKNKLRVIAALLCLCVCLLTILSISFLVFHSHHHCIGDGCPVCSEITYVAATLQTLAGAAVKVVPAIITLFLPVLTLIDLIRTFIAIKTSVTLKVKMNN